MLLPNKSHDFIALGCRSDCCCLGLLFLFCALRFFLPFHNTEIPKKVFVYFSYTFRTLHNLRKKKMWAYPHRYVYVIIYRILLLKMPNLMEDKKRLFTGGIAPNDDKNKFSFRPFATKWSSWCLEVQSVSAFSFVVIISVI